jgi:hypothetical protein
MRPRFLIFVVIVVLLIVALLFWRRPVQPPVKTEQPQTVVQTANVPITTATPPAVAPTPAPVPTVNQPPLVPGTDAERLEKIREQVETANVPVYLYGVVIDQDSNAVPGVKIKSTVRHWTMPNPNAEMTGTTEIPLETTTGADGRFELSGATGDVFGILLSRDGYIISPKTPRGFGGGTSGSYENPVVFKMWKIGEKAQLITGSKFWGIIPDGRIYTIDFIQDTKTESATAPGDIRVSFVRPAQVKPRTAFDWSFSMEAIQGGLIETKDDFMYWAPASGYQPDYQITMDSTNADWKRELDGLQFYLVSRNGQVYGRFSFDLIPDYNDVGIFNVNWAVNPNGSRNLQP